MTDIERAEEFEKEAEEYVRKIRHDVINWDGAEPDERFYNEIKFKQAYLAGAELGYTKANEWHKVADGRDLPKNNTAVLVILKNKRMKISIFMENKFTIWNNDYDAYTKLYDVIAWCEVPKFEE